MKLEGIFAVNKPKGMTSHDVVNTVRKATGVKKVGHGGTLDPLASGVLVIAVGRENTKQLDTFVKGEKEYVATIKLGFTSTTDDEEGEKTAVLDRKPSREEIEHTLKTFIGTISQLPPMYSALKIKGRPAYKIARSSGSQENLLKPRDVLIKNIELTSYQYPLLIINVTTGPGTYIRSLARDVGEKLATGAYLADLTRTRVNTYTLQDSIAFENI